jgi:hypothetical protein
MGHSCKILVEKNGFERDNVGYSGVNSYKTDALTSDSAKSR